MTGDEWAKPGMVGCHRMFSPRSTFQRTTAAAFVSSPLACGPRNWGQLAADKLVATKDPSKSEAALAQLGCFGNRKRSCRRRPAWGLMGRRVRGPEARSRLEPQ